MIKIIYPIEIFIGLFKELGENDADCCSTLNFKTQITT